jgi:hypothetical protein
LFDTNFPKHMATKTKQEQTVHFRCRPQLKEKIARAAEMGGMAPSQWVRWQVQKILGEVPADAFAPRTKR